MYMFRKAFTLIELLIVVAIIAILAAIAVPNFLEAQTRAKVSRCRADMRSLATAIETYLIDYNTYLYCNIPSNAIDTRPNRPNSRPTFERLTTPVAYLSSFEAFADPFKPQGIWSANLQNNTGWPRPTDEFAARYYYYTARNAAGDANARWDELPGEAKPLSYIVEASGPDGMRHQMRDVLNLRPPTDPWIPALIYDSTNGTVSRGSIWRVGGTGSISPTDMKFHQLAEGSY